MCAAVNVYCRFDPTPKRRNRMRFNPFHSIQIQFGVRTHSATPNLRTHRNIGTAWNLQTNVNNVHTPYRLLLVAWSYPKCMTETETPNSRTTIYSLLPAVIPFAPIRFCPTAKACARIPRALCFCIHAIWRPHGVPSPSCQSHCYVLSIHAVYYGPMPCHAISTQAPPLLYIVGMLLAHRTAPIVLVAAVPTAHMCIGAIAARTACPFFLRSVEKEILIWWFWWFWFSLYNVYLTDGWCFGFVHNILKDDSLVVLQFWIWFWLREVNRLQYLHWNNSVGCWFEIKFDCAEKKEWEIKRYRSKYNGFNICDRHSWPVIFRQSLQRQSVTLFSWYCWPKSFFWKIIVLFDSNWRVADRS